MHPMMHSNPQPAFFAAPSMPAPQFSSFQQQQTSSTHHPPSPHRYQQTFIHNSMVYVNQNFDNRNNGQDTGSTRKTPKTAKDSQTGPASTKKKE